MNAEEWKQGWVRELRAAGKHDERGTIALLIAIAVAGIICGAIYINGMYLQYQRNTGDGVPTSVTVDHSGD